MVNSMNSPKSMDPQITNLNSNKPERENVRQYRYSKTKKESLPTYQISILNTNPVENFIITSSWNGRAITNYVKRIR